MVPTKKRSFERLFMIMGIIALFNNLLLANESLTEPSSPSTIKNNFSHPVYFEGHYSSDQGIISFKKEVLDLLSPEYVDRKIEGASMFNRKDDVFSYETSEDLENIIEYLDEQDSDTLPLVMVMGARDVSFKQRNRRLLMKSIATHNSPSLGSETEVSGRDVSFRQRNRRPLMKSIVTRNSPSLGSETEVSGRDVSFRQRNRRPLMKSIVTRNSPSLGSETEISGRDVSFRQRNRRPLMKSIVTRNSPSLGSETEISGRDVSFRQRNRRVLIMPIITHESYCESNAESCLTKTAREEYEDSITAFIRKIYHSLDTSPFIISEMVDESYYFDPVYSVGPSR